jgi:hypothetical protein
MTPDSKNKSETEKGHEVMGKGKHDGQGGFGDPCL